MTSIQLVGRSSSHFTRTARIFAVELEVPHTFKPVLDILSTEAATFAGNPALKVPVLVDEQGLLVGTENICRELTRRSGRRGVILRNDVPSRVVANAEELTLHVMSAEVTLILAKLAGDPRLAPPKATRSIENALSWLDENLDAVLAALPGDRVLSFVEVALYCVVTHLPFRDIMDISRYARLGAFCARFGERASARSTEYRFDAAG